MKKIVFNQESQMYLIVAAFAVKLETFYGTISTEHRACMLHSLEILPSFLFEPYHLSQWVYCCCCCWALPFIEI